MNKKQLNILYTCDNNYLPLTSISMASVIYNNPNAYITFYIATEDENSDNFEKLVNFYKDNEKIKVKYLNVKKYDSLLESKKLDRWGSNSYYVYWKLFAYDDLDIDYIWYLDSDVICVSQIDNPSLNNKAIGSCLDSAHYTFNRVAHINEDYYLFNTGSLFIDVKKWKENNCTQKVVKYINEMKYKPLMCDQDILAIALQDDIEVLDTKYDYLVCYDYYGIHNTYEMYSLNKKPYYKESEVENSKNKIVFYHCLGGVFGRPWQKGNYSPIKDEFNKYKKLACWNEYETEFNKSLLFKIEGCLEFLPKPIYNRIHNMAQRIYVKNMAKNSL